MIRRSKDIPRPYDDEARRLLVILGIILLCVAVGSCLIIPGL